MFDLTVFDIAFVAMFTTGILIRAPHDKQNRLDTKVKSKFDSREKVALLSAVLGATLFPFLYLVTPLLNFANYQVSIWQGLAGIILSIPSTWLFWRSHKDLGRQFSPTLEIKTSHELITSGVYKRIRHPMYTAVLLTSISQLLLLGNWIAGPAYLVGFLFLYFSRINKEEALMLEQFGEQYSAYIHATNRLFPKFNGHT